MPNGKTSVYRIEKESLEAHVDLCAERYNTMHEKLKVIETRQDTLYTIVLELKDKITSSHQSMTKVVIGATGTIMAGLLSTIVVMLIQMG